MQIAGWIPNSLVDYPGNVAMTVFTAGCNMNCWYCHNRHLIKPSDTHVRYTGQSILADLERKAGFLDAVVLSGGEPTLQQGLAEFAAKAKELGYLVKLDTNGTRPQVIQTLLDDRLVDYIAMDIKAPFGRYDEICRCAVDMDAVQQSIGIIMASGMDYEFRTTLTPELMKEDVEKMAQDICGAKRYVLQQYRPVPHARAQLPHSPAYVQECAEAISGRAAVIEVRGI